MPEFVLHHLQPGQAAPASSEITDPETSELLHKAMLNGEVSGAIEKGLHRPVALVQCAKIDDVFPITNHIDHDWTTNREVLRSESKVRSTSVGDVVVDCQQSRAWACRTVGWEELPHTPGLARLIAASNDYLAQSKANPQPLH